MNRKLKSNHKKYKKEVATDIYHPFTKKSKRKAEKERQTYLETLSNNFNIPSDIIAGAPILTVTGNNQLCLENYKGIIEYTGNVIRVQTKICRIHIIGVELNIDYFTDEEMKISGVIQNIQYC